MQEIFNFKGQEVRTVTIDDEPYFVGKDVAEILGYAKARNAIASHVDDEDKKDAPIQGTLGGTQTMTIINESGLYSLILSSKLPQAKEFKRWVTSEVLPTIRKHGYLIKRNGRDWNMPTQKSVELGLIRVKETSITHSDGHITVSKTPLVTGKGQQYFINKFLNQEYLPV
ncbi:TPA: Bro-N domain-containing protein [Streptococcus pyogenes NGAS290]|nr:Bro-N domain-containing protein [Streptococcus pyogenes NGAS292]HER4738646.1 Bro-N domain-containing protein [Streptococcus pyogenes NGAS291]HER4745517.1 Bro-N domain-containing protein [Streptococcus pyogenes NGAS290]